MGWAVVKARSTEDAEAGANCELEEDPAELEAGDVGVPAIAARVSLRQRAESSVRNDRESKAARA